MADATTAAKDRIDRALATLERKVLELKARPAVAAPITDDDLFASVADTVATVRVAELEAAGREASMALARAADQLRELMVDVSHADAADGDV